MPSTLHNSHPSRTTHHAYHRWRKFKNALMQALAFACAMVVVVPLGLIVYHVLKSGIGALNWAFITRLPKPVGEIGGGMANALAGTFELLGLASLFGVPAGVAGRAGIEPETHSELVVLQVVAAHEVALVMAAVPHSGLLIVSSEPRETHP